MKIKNICPASEIPTYLFAKGYCKERLYQLEFSRHFSEEEKQRNLAFANSHSADEVKAWADKNAAETHEILMEVASLFKAYDVHQFSPETSTMAHYNSDWDLFWYSNKGWNRTNYTSYFTLSFNEKRDERKNFRLYQEIIELLSSSDILNVTCSVKRIVEWNDKKLAADAAVFAERLKGSTVVYSPFGFNMEGKIKPVENGYGFFKKNSKSKYYDINNLDIVKIYHEVLPAEKNDFDFNHDAVFAPGIIHGQKDELYIMYENRDANEGKGAMEIMIVDAKTILELYEKSGNHAYSFFNLLPDFVSNKSHYYNAPSEQYDNCLKFYHRADFIEGVDGDIHDELEFIVEWAKSINQEEC